MDWFLKISFGVVGLLAASYAAILYWCYRNQRRLMYAPTQRDGKGRGSRAFAPFRTDSGEFLGYLRECRSPKRAVIFFHGNGGEALDREWIGEIVPNDQLLILAEYPGYGARPGDASEASILADADRLLDQVHHRWGKLPITAIGESLGSGVACGLAGKKKVERVALIAPFSSARDVAIKFYPLLPVRWLLRDSFDCVAKVRTAEAPLHIIHGTLDEVVPISLGRKLFENYPAEKKEFTEIPGFGHNQFEDAVVHSPFAHRFREFIQA